MIFSGLKVMGEKPFSDVLIHGIVRDSQGRKMSKTLGNGIDPIEVIDEYSADALRFSLLSGTTMGNDIRYMPEKLEQASNFANKIWNAAKFILMNRTSEEDIVSFKKENYDEENEKYKDEALNIEDKWILNKLNELIKEVTTNIEHYDVGVAIDKIYNFMWNEFCDWYIEMAKIRLYSNDEKAKIQVSFVLNEVFINCLKLLHPFMPFVTTEIYNNMVNYGEDELIVSKWPEVKNNDYSYEEKLIEKIKNIIVEIRNIRNTKNIHPSKKSGLIFVTEKYESELKQLENILLKFGFGNNIEIYDKKENLPERVVSILSDGIDVYLPLDELINIEEEKKRLEEEKKKLESEVLRCEKMLSNEGFIAKAPAKKVEEEKEKLKRYKELLNATKNQINSL